MMHITAVICFCIREFDMAGSNKRMIAHEDNLICASSNSIAPINKFCDSHANNHVQSDVVYSALFGGLIVMNCMYSAARLLRMGAVWFQLLRALPTFCRLHLKVINGVPDPRDKVE